LRFADGHRDWIQAKLSVRPGDDAWQKLWTNLLALSRDEGFGADDRLLVIIGDHGPVTTQLRDICDRAATAVDVTEWLSRVGDSMRQLVTAIERVLGVATADVLELLRRTSVEVAHRMSWSAPSSDAASGLHLSCRGDSFQPSETSPDASLVAGLFSSHRSYAVDLRRSSEPTSPNPLNGACRLIAQRSSGSLV
jgi:hypothetical protein